MARIGYARVSSVGQSLESQQERLSDCDKVFCEKRSGKDGGRPQLRACLRYMQEGDTLVVTKLDRLARSTPDLYRIVAELTDKNAQFVVLDDPLINTTSRTGKLVMGILSLIAEFENDIRRERQMDGIARARANGVRLGPPAKVTPEVVAEIERRRFGDREAVPKISKALNLSRSTVYRVLGQSKAA